MPLEIGRLLARHPQNRVVRVGEQLARRYLRAVGNWNYDFSHNGERWFLEQLDPHTVFDVGANVGEYTRLVRELHPGAIVHSFEIVPSTARICAERFAHDEAVTVNVFGLGHGSGTVAVKHFAGFSPFSTTFDFDHGPDFEWVDGRVEVGAEYAEAHGIGQIDLLKIDTEGADYDVLVGFSQMLAEQRVGAVQFEYGQVNILTHHLLRDHYEFLGKFGYKVGKLYPDHIDFRPYDITRSEDFLGPNYVAVQSEAALITRVE